MNVLSIQIPALRERTEDIRILVDHFIKKYLSDRRSGPRVKGVDQEVERLFFEYQWMGNVRELENVIERAVILCPDDIIHVSDLPQNFQNHAEDHYELKGIPAEANLQETLNMIEKKMIERALKMTNHVQSSAADLLGIGRSGLSKKLRKHGII